MTGPIFGHWLGRHPEHIRPYIRDRALTHTWAALPALGSVLMGGVLSFSLWQAFPDIRILIWILVLGALAGAGYMARRLNALKWVFLAEMLTGLMWLLVTFLFPDGRVEQLMFFALVVLGAGLFSAVSQYAFLPAALVAIGAALPCFALWCFLHGGDDYLLMGFFAFAGWVGAMGLAWFLHATFVNRVGLLFEKSSLLQSVEDKIAELDRLRKLETGSRLEAEDANAAKSRFLAHASHDLRQPLHAIGLLLATVPDKGLGAHTKHVLDRVRQSLDVLSDLFDSLLDVALLDTGQIEVNRSIFPLHDVLAQIAVDFNETAKTKSVELRYCPTTLLAHSDPVILRRMVQNLVSNAIQHAHGNTVLFGVRRTGARLRIEVHDSGAGIASKDQKRIFEEFTKLEGHTSKNDMPGLGLGLAIVQRLAKITDVNIVLTSKIGVGSVFRIENIVRARSIIADVKTPANNAAFPTPQTRISILDDDPEVLEATESLVTKWGFQADVYTVYTPDAFRKPDIILCDYELRSEQNGVEIIEAIRNKFDQKIPAVLITGNSSKDIMDLAKTLGVPVLYKPVRPAQLRSVLLTALSDENR